MRHIRSALRILLGALCVLAAGLLVAQWRSQMGCVDLPLAAPCVRVLFIGNSYTSVNELPRTFAALASAGGHPVETGMLTDGGWRLADHAAAPRTGEALRAKPWEYVVLQEQSVIPSIASLRATVMYPAARRLAGQIRAVGATPIFFATWAHRQGWPEQGMRGFRPMQDQLTQGYTRLARELDTPLAPVGEAWRLALAEHPELSLWQDDGSHPSEQGTYLAGCVMYAAIFRQSPEGLSYTAQLPADIARALQDVAATVVLQHPERWNLPATTTPARP